MTNGTGPPNSGHKKKTAGGRSWGDNSNGRVDCLNHTQFDYSTYVNSLQDTSPVDFNLPLSSLIDAAVLQIELCNQAAETANALANHYRQEAEFWRRRASIAADYKRLFETAVPRQSYQPDCSKDNSRIEVSPNEGSEQ